MPTAERIARRCACGIAVALLGAAPVLGAAADRLPATVLSALERAGVPPDAMVATVHEIDRPRALLAWQAERSVNPASLAKLLTTYAALDRLGPAWQWRTPVWLDGPVQGGVLEGNLVVKGSGDPKLVLERVWLMLRRVRQLGVREIHGDIVLDRSAFEVPEQNAAEFDGEPQRAYNVGADALMLNFKAIVFTFTPDPAHGVARVASEPPLEGLRAATSVPMLAGGGCGDWRAALRADFTDASQVHFAGSYPAGCGEKTWSAAYAQPRRYNERALQGMWREMGGRLTGTVRDGVAPPGAPTFEFASPPLAEVVRDINKFSNNVMAQQLFLTLGLVQRGRGTAGAAREALARWAVERLGPTHAAAIVVDNGSGLSRSGRLTASALARLLQVAWAGPAMPEFVSSLPVSGSDGTLKRAGAGAASAHLKTGSLRDVNGMAGFVHADSGKRYAVVAIVNHPNAQAARPALDALVQWVHAGAP